MSESLTVWSLVALVIAAVVIPYWSAFNKRLHRDRQRKAEAERLGIDRPIAQFPFVDSLRCIGCGACIEACPEGDVLGVVGGTAVVINGLRCVGHGRCEMACPVDGIEVGLGDLQARRDVPLLDGDLQTTIPGIFVAGELGGLALVKNAAEQGRAVIEFIGSRIHGAAPLHDAKAVDVAIIGAGPAGLSAALAASAKGLSYLVLEKESSLGGSLLHYPRRKMVLTQPLQLSPWGALDREEYQKEELLTLFEQMVREMDLDLRFDQEVQAVTPRQGGLRIETSDTAYAARHLVMAIGRRGSPRKLQVPGEELPKVMYRLLDAQAYRGQKILVVGGGDSAAEAAIGLARQTTNTVTLSYRKEKLVRLKRKNLEAIERQIASERIQGVFSSAVTEIGPDRVVLQTADGNALEIENDYVFIFAGGVPPYPLLQRIGIRFGGEATSSSPMPAQTAGPGR